MLPYLRCPEVNDYSKVPVLQTEETKTFYYNSNFFF